MQLPDGYHELLGVLASDLASELGRIMPAMPGTARDGLALTLAEHARQTVGGMRLRSAPDVPAADLPAADWLTYGRLANVWEAELLRALPDQPHPWAQVAVLRLLDVLRSALGGEYVPKCAGRDQVARIARNDEMWRAFRGDYREVAITFNVTAERARQILKARLESERRSRQGSLFPDA